jgi:hypothetical protein
MEIVVFVLGLFLVCFTVFVVIPVSYIAWTNSGVVASHMRANPDCSFEEAYGFWFGSGGA